VVTFLSHSQCIAAGAQNPVSLCWLGEAVIGAQAQVAETKARVLSTRAYRLITTTPQAGVTPLWGTNPKGLAYAWVPYKRQDGEFSIPHTQEEAEAVLDGMQSGRVPVFDDPPEPVLETKEEQAARLKKEGNAAFGKKKWGVAAGKYSEAIALQPDSIHLLYGNRAMCRLKQSRWQNALNDANKCIEHDANYSKGYARKVST
jgi:hypothetical protein